MSRNHKKPQKFIPVTKAQLTNASAKPITSLLDVMIDGREFESLVQYPKVNTNIRDEIRRALAEIEEIRKRPIVCYLANSINPKLKESPAITSADDVPFSEMIGMVDAEARALDIILATPGGSGEQVARFVDRLRPRFDHVTFIIPSTVMSAGTIFATSGNEIVMDSRAYIGPTDPQVPNRDGAFVPAQSIITLISEIQQRGATKLAKGQNPDWTDLQILRQIDAKEIGRALKGTEYSVELVEEYLYKYKFSSWTTHARSGLPVTDEEKKATAKQVATMLCNHDVWKTHSRGISREVARQVCGIKIDHVEDTPGLERAVRRLWAVMQWVFLNSNAYKIFVSKNYSIFRNDPSIAKQ